ncbi:hypothetical protein [Wukongibacter baidiensis]
MKVDKRYNRIEDKDKNNSYYMKFGFNNNRDNIKYTGYIKCKLVHDRDLSLIVPDYVFIDFTDGLKWYQPLCFLPNLIMKNIDVATNIIYVDISSGNSIRVEFTNKDFIKEFDDNSQLYRCNIYGTTSLIEYATGDAYFDKNNIPYIQLFHHTKEEFKKLILEEMSFKLSKWNIQGNKKIHDKGYVYFTPLDKIINEGDLRQIAMSGVGKINLIPDYVPVPPRSQLPYKTWLDTYKNDIVEIEVYRENSVNRSATIELFIDTTILAPHHIYKHKIQNTYYEIFKPFIERICTDSVEDYIKINGNKIFREENDIFNPQYIIIGDCSERKGLRAPFDEDDPEYIFKIDSCKNINFLDYWFEHANTNIYKSLNVDCNKYK